MNDSEILVRAHDFGSGSVLWEDRAHRSSNSGAQDVALNGTRLFVVGQAAETESPDVDFFIRAYDVSDIERPQVAALD